VELRGLGVNVGMEESLYGFVRTVKVEWSLT